MGNPGIEPAVVASPEALDGAAMSSLLGYDAACLTCGYNLRGLPLSGVCPECSAPVENASSTSSQAPAR